LLVVTKKERIYSVATSSKHLKEITLREEEIQSFVDQIESQLPNAACHAATELDNVRLGRHSGPLKFLAITHQKMVEMYPDRDSSACQMEFLDFGLPLLVKLGLTVPLDEQPKTTRFEDLFTIYEQLCERLSKCLSDYQADGSIDPEQRQSAIKELLAVSEMASLYDHKHRRSCGFLVAA
jgi:hypothetical protein